MFIKFMVLVLTLVLGVSTAQAQSTARFHSVQNRDCQIWNPRPVLNETVVWTGKCVNGKGVGKGIIAYGNVRNGKAVISVSEVTLKGGKHQGHGQYYSSSGQSTYRKYSDGKRVLSTPLYHGSQVAQKKAGEADLVSAQYPGHLIKGIDLKLLKQLLEDSGMKFQKASTYSSGSPLVYFTDADDNTYVIGGAICNQTCNAIQLTAVIKRSTPIDYSEINTQDVKYSVASIMRFQSKPNQISINRYVILDGGQNPHNLILEIKVFTQIVEIIRNNIGGENVTNVLNQPQ
ncbi:hypothetical protein JYT95_00400 [bacterium AH-315-J23]|nr:hypothetical protein [bacterium AH-315-J23]PHQ67394.1 MAG: hypothetical protein COB92_04410 [Robiginitomaculum sp.]